MIWYYFVVIVAFLSLGLLDGFAESKGFAGSDYDTGSVDRDYGLKRAGSDGWNSKYEDNYDSNYVDDDSYVGDKRDRDIRNIAARLKKLEVVVRNQRQAARRMRMKNGMMNQKRGSDHKTSL